MPKSAAYFPLRSNASSLIAGAGVASVRRRIMLSALLHDVVWLEHGVWDSHTGEGGGMSMWRPADGTERWQTPAERGKETGANFYVAFRSSEAPDTAPMHAFIQSAAAIAWRATLEPFKDELPRRAGNWDWLRWTHLDDHPEAKQIAGRWHWVDRDDPDIRALWPSSFIRDAYLTGTQLDLAMGGLARVGVAIDRAHEPVVNARVRAGQAELVKGGHLLDLLVPGDLTWQDVAELRRSQRALREYRAVLADVEAAATDNAVSVPDLERLLRDEYAGRVAAAAALRPRRAVTYTLAGVSFVVGSVAGPAGLAVGSAVAAGTLVAGEVVDHLSRPRWLTVDAGLRHRRLRK